MSPTTSGESWRSRRLDWLESSKKCQFIAHVWPAAPANENRGVCFKILAGNFGPMHSHKETGVAGRFDFWLGRDNAGHTRGARQSASGFSKGIGRRARDSCAMKGEKCRADQRKNERPITPAQPCQCA